MLYYIGSLLFSLGVSYYLPKKFSKVLTLLHMIVIYKLTK